MKKQNTKNQVRNSEKCEQCEQLRLELEKLTAPKPFTLKPTYDKESGEIVGYSDLYEISVVLGLVEKDSEKTFESRKAFKEIYNQALCEPKNATALVRVYCEKGWSLDDLNRVWEERKEEKARKRQEYLQANKAFKEIDITRKAVRKHRLTNEQFQMMFL